MRGRYHHAAMMVCAVVLLAEGAGPAVAQHGRPVSIPERARGAERVVVGRVVRTEAVEQVNAYGDRLIVSRALIEVEEHMKGPPVDALLVDVEGGTLGGITMKVSDLPSVREGERAVFFLDRGSPGRYVPHWRGLGILKLNGENYVEGSGISLDQIRAGVAAAGR